MMNLLYMLPLNLLIYNMHENRDNSRLYYKKFALGQYQNKLEVDHALNAWQILARIKMGPREVGFKALSHSFFFSPAET